MCRFGLALCLGIALVSITGCSSGTRADVPPSIEVKGAVTLDGAPLPEGEITFEMVGKAHSTLPIKDGSFSGTAYEGKNRVAIRAFKAGPPLSTEPSGPPTKINFVPSRFNDESKLEEEVTAAGPNDFKFAVTSR